MSKNKELELKSANFLSHRDLGLNHNQYCGLVKTLALLEAGELDHENSEHNIGEFDMNYWRNEASWCGTICCIGGTASIVMKSRGLYGPEYGMGVSPELTKVFYPGGELQGQKNHPGWDGTTKQAAKVLRHYLETGKGDWDIAFPKK